MPSQYKINFSLRILSCIILSIIPSLYFFEILPYFVLPIWCLVLIFMCHKIVHNKVVLASSILIISLSSIIFWFLFFIICKIISQNFFDILYLRIKIILPFIILQTILISITTTIFLRTKKYKHYEPLIFIVIFSILFISQKNYSLSVFNHPIKATLFSIAFLFLEITRLFLSNNFLKKHIKFYLVFVPIFFIIMLFILKNYNIKSSSNNGGLLQPTIFRFDFSDFLELQSEIKLKDDLVLIAKFKNEFSHCMIRRMYLSGWDLKKGFFPKKAPDEKKQITTLPDGRKKINHTQFDLREKADQEYFFVNISPRSFLAMDYPIEVIPYKIWDSKKFNGGYKVISEAIFSFAEDLYSQEFPIGDPIQGLTKKDLEFYTKIDNKTKKLVKQTAIEITKDVPDYLDKIIALQEYFTNGEYKYSLKPGKAPDGNQLKYFLNTTKKGYCTYYAFAFTLMLRSIGIPARVAVGFITLPESEIMNYYPIRANMAHAWTEVFFPNIGWISFDATSSNLAEGENLSFNFNAGGKEFNSLLNEILENRNQIKIAKIIEEENTSITKTIINYIKHFFYKHTSIINILIIIIIIFSFLLYKLYPILIINFSKNNRKIILTIGKIFIRKKKNYTPELFNLIQKAKFAPKCTKEDVDTAFKILKQGNKNDK